MALISKTIKGVFFISSGLTILHAQTTPIHRVMILNYPMLKNQIAPDTFLTFAGRDWAPAWNKDNPKTHLGIYRADRGADKNQFLLAYMMPEQIKRNAGRPSTPFGRGINKKTKSVLTRYLLNPEEFTEYHLIGADQFKTLPDAGILGLHYIRVRPERTADFEKLVIDKLHPALGALLPDMQMLYYKRVDGNTLDYKDSPYLTVFTIASPVARDKYWPSGMPETEILKQAFRPWNELARELSNYLVEGSYLLPGNGAAAIFESKRWTDYIHYHFLN